MHNSNFQDFLDRLCELGEIDIAMSEVKLFLNTHASEAELKTTLTLLQGRSSLNEKGKNAGTISDSDYKTERNQIIKSFNIWVDEFKIATIKDVEYKDYGQYVPDELYNDVFEDEEANSPTIPLPPFEPTPPSSRWKAWLLSLLLLPLGYMGYQYMQRGKTEIPSEKGCILEVYPGCKLYSEPNDKSPIIMDVPTGSGESYKQIDAKGVNSYGYKYVFFKIKVQNTEGWINYNDGVRKTTECFEVEKEALINLSVISPLPKKSVTPLEPSSHRASDKSKNNNKQSEEDAFKQKGKDFDREFEAHKREIEEGTNKAKQDAEQFKKEFDSKWKKQQ
jgi:hypothetical protein